MGVVMSGDVYLRLTGYTFVFGPAESKLGLKGSIARPLLVVDSGKTTTYRFGFCAISMCRSSISAPSGGASFGWKKFRATASNRDTRRTCRVVGYEAVKIGSKMAAR